MIIYEFKEGQGLGNQLWCYFSLRSIAKHLDISFFHFNLKLFKGKKFQVKILSNFNKKGKMHYGELFIKGKSKKEIFFTRILILGVR